MCSIAGLLFKAGKPADFGMTTGEALTRMLDATVHRGPDSAGWALYREPIGDDLRMRFFVENGDSGEGDAERIRNGLAEQGAKIVEEGILGWL